MTGAAPDLFASLGAGGTSLRTPLPSGRGVPPGRRRGKRPASGAGARGGSGGGGGAGGGGVHGGEDGEAGPEGGAAAGDVLFKFPPRYLFTCTVGRNSSKAR